MEHGILFRKWKMSHASYWRCVCVLQFKESLKGF